MKKAHKRNAKLFKFLRVTKLPYLPSVLNIDPSNICNLKCPLCPTGSGAEGAKKGFLSLKLFKAIFDQMKYGLKAINLYSWGEPLLNRELFDIIKYSKNFDPGIYITTSTNLNVLDERVLAGLMDSGIDEVIISCDGASPEAYFKYRVGGDFDLVIRNIRFLADYKAKHFKKTKLVWNFLVFKHNEHEIEKAKAMALSLNVDFRIGLMRVTMKDEILKPHAEVIKKDLAWIPDNPSYSAYDKVSCSAKKKITSCRKPWQEISVNWDGTVFPCCAVFGDVFNFGDAKLEEIKKLWNNRMFMAARREILVKNKDVLTVCGVCRKNGFMHM